MISRESFAAAFKTMRFASRLKALKPPIAAGLPKIKGLTWLHLLSHLLS